MPTEPRTPRAVPGRRVDPPFPCPAPRGTVPTEDAATWIGGPAARTGDHALAITTCIFDAYGTLFDVTAAARRAAAEPGGEALAPVWQRIAQDWRAKQLQYTWLRAAAGRHCDFAQVTRDGLDWALEAAGLAEAAVTGAAVTGGAVTGGAPKGEAVPDGTVPQPGSLRDRLLDLYRTLDAYPEVPAMLAALRARGLATGILSNGSPGMLADAVGSAGIGGLLDAVLSVEEVGVFKPAPQVYDMVGARFGCAKDEVLFVSSNGWDACGAAGYGFRTAWVNRAGDPMDRLYARPQHVLSDLVPIPDLV